jgi:hypothetical protein
MARKYLVSIENIILMVLMVILALIVYIHFIRKPAIRRPAPVPAPAFMAPIQGRVDVFNDPYAPPLKNDGLYFRGDSSDIRGVPPIPQGVRVNVETRSTGMSYSQMGILTRDDLILPLMGRQHMSGRDKWQYYTISNTGNLNTKLPVSVKGKSCTSEYGCDQIMNGDHVYVEGYKNTFNATVYENNMFSYLPQL